MNLNQGKRNKQAVQVLNKIEYDSDGNPIGMMEDPSNPASANFGTPREPRRGGCYKGDGSAYVDMYDSVPVVQNFSIEFDIIYKSTGGFQNVLCYNFHRIGSDYYGFSLMFNYLGVLSIYVSQQISTSVTLGEDEYSKIRIDMCESYTRVYKNGNLVHSTGNVPIYFDESKDLKTTIGRWWRDYGSNQQYYFRSKIWNVRINELDSAGNYVQTLAKYNCSENSGTICYDSSGNGHHGTIINAITTTPEENPNSIHQYQDVYSFENEEGYSESGSVLIPKNSSITLPPFKDVLGNNLQYVSKVPGKAKFVGSSCFLSDGNAYLSGDVLTTDTITAHTESEVPVCTIDGRLDFPIVGGKYFDVTIERGGNVIARLPLCEPITDPSNHTYHDVSANGNHATLVNGTLANEGKQDTFHYLQRGLVKRSTGETIPILEDESGFADGSLLNDVDAIPQDSHSFLNAGTELEAYDYPALKQADKDDDFWNEDDGLGTIVPKPVQFDNLITQKGLSDKLFLDSSVSNTIKNIRMYGSDLKGRQLNTENKLTNN